MVFLLKKEFFDNLSSNAASEVLEQTKVNGNTYILVTDSEEDEAECLILRDISDAKSPLVTFLFPL